MFPKDFAEYTERLMGAALWRAFSNAMTEPSPVSIRTNPLKRRGAEPDGGGTGGQARVPWCANGIYLPERPAFTYDPLLHAGTYYVQEAASMFVDTIIRQYITRPVLMLDLCAAPGGKSTAARTALPEGSLLVSNEPVRLRANILSENIQKFGHGNVAVTNNYPADYRRAGIMFDAVIADVPCSGEGMFRKDAEAVAQWSVQNVEKCRNLQREILSEIWQCLKPGGIMIYSTCTFNTKENEENVRFIAEELGADVLPVATDEAWGIGGSLLEGFDSPVYRFIPGITRSEGLFVAVVRKHGDATGYNRGKKTDARGKKNKAPARDTVPAECRRWLKDSDRYDLSVRNATVTATPKAWAKTFDALYRNLRVMHAGVTLGEIKGKDIVPAQSLALSADLNTEAFATVELDYDSAISYLAKEPVPLPGGTPRGAVLVTYKGHAIGFEKNIGNRANNLYPNEWKIKHKRT